MDSESDFLNAEFLYILLFAGQNLLIYPFTYASKLEGLKRVLEPVFKIEEFDISNINTVEIFQLYCSNVASVIPQSENGDLVTKKPLIIFEKGLGAYLPEIKNFEMLQFIALEKGNDVKSLDANIISYNKKLHEFDNFTMEGKSKTEKDALDYCKFLMVENDLEVSVQVFLNKVIGFTQILSDFSVLSYQHFAEETNEIEMAACKLFCERYFNLNPDGILPNQATLNESLESLKPQADSDLELLAKTEQEIEQVDQEAPVKKTRKGSKQTKGKKPEKSTLDAKIKPEADVSKEINAILETPIEIQKMVETPQEIKHVLERSKEVGDNSSEANENIGDLETDQPPEYQYFLELTKLRENPDIYIIFEHQLACISVDNNTLTTPESKYEYLRKNQWKNGIPFDFLIQLLHQYLLQLSKIGPAKFNGPSSEKTLKEEYEKMLTLFMNCDIDDRFTNYTLCREHIRKFFTVDPSAQEPENVQVLPIYGNSKWLKPQHEESRKTSSNLKQLTIFDDYWEKLKQKYPKINNESIKAIIQETSEIIQNIKQSNN